jgi:nicotinamide-nucleotide amidase
MSTIAPINQNIKKIALLATGDELVGGDILNTNGQKIAQILKDNGFAIGMHLIVSDDEQELVAAINFLLNSHDIIITTGGLGPTSDDRTRFAYSQALNKPLIFDDASWQHIVDRLQRYNLDVHASNRQQALFPDGAIVVPNDNGTANGCYILTNDKKAIFMLPGPPNECLPMFQQYILPILLQEQHRPQYYHAKWRLFGVAEGEIGAILDALLSPFSVITGYRWDYPYLEFKIRTEDQSIIPEMATLIEKTIKPYLIATPEQTASQILREKIPSYHGLIMINDHATGGLLQHSLLNHTTRGHLQFVHKKPKNLANLPNLTYIEISGMDEFWQNQKNLQGNTTIEILFQTSEKNYCIKSVIPFRNPRVTSYAVELICHHITNYLFSE